jgi:hypothetical protein
MGHLVCDEQLPLHRLRLVVQQGGLQGQAGMSSLRQRSEMMNKLELIGLAKLEEYLYKVLERLQDKEEGRQEHLRTFTKGDLERAIDVVKALKENNKD